MYNELYVLMYNYLIYFFIFFKSYALLDSLTFNPQSKSFSLNIYIYVYVGKTANSSSSFNEILFCVLA